MVKKNKLIVLLAMLMTVVVPANAQFKNLKNIKTKVTKVVKKEVKPLTLNYKITKVRYNPIKSLNIVGLNIDFYGNNPNKIGVSLDRIEFDLYVDKKHASKFYNEKKIEIPKGKAFTFEEKADFKLSTLGKSVFNAIIKKKATYSVNGTYYLETPFGVYPIKATLTEKKM